MRSVEEPDDLSLLDTLAIEVDEVKRPKMIVVIRCGAAQQHIAGRLRMPDGQDVMFVSNPDNAPQGGSIVSARPDDTSD